MQSLGRPVARVALGIPILRQPCVSRLCVGNLGLSKARGSWGASPFDASNCVRPLRFYASTPQPPNDADRTTSKPEGKNEAASSVGETDFAPAQSQSSPQNGVKEKFSQVMDNLQSRVLTASKTLNEVTGYADIEAIKAENDALETSLAEAHARLRAARHAYKSSNAKRAATQREVTTLLARKETWSPSDLERFTELYRTDHVLEGEVSAAQEALTEAEAEEQSLSQRLNSGILKRYHEEQIWSDRIRRASTWGTWGLMGMNFLLFVVLQFVAEPWKRRRLVRGVVAEEKEVLEEVRGELAAVKASLELRRQEEDRASVSAPIESIPSPAPVPEATIEVVPTTTWGHILADPQLWKLAVEDLCSERRADLRMRDASVLALEAAAAGVACTLSIFWLLARRS